MVFLNRKQHFANFKPLRFQVLFGKIDSVYFIGKNIFIFLQWKWPAQGTSSVPVVPAHFRSHDRFSQAHGCDQQTDTQPDHATTATVGRTLCCAR